LFHHVSKPFVTILYMVGDKGIDNRAHYFCTPEAR
jgi:hypothetical protein